MLCDLLWADPDADMMGWGYNSRGVSYTFGHDVIQDFLGRHDLDLICRAHQVVEDGYKFEANRQLCTIFSAPNYCGEFDNAGAILTVREDLVCSFKVMRPLSHKLKLEEVRRQMSIDTPLFPSFSHGEINSPPPSHSYINRPVELHILLFREAMQSHPLTSFYLTPLPPFSLLILPRLSLRNLPPFLLTM